MDVDARLEAMEAENERLQDRVWVLEDCLGASIVALAPIEWRLTLSEARIFGALYQRASCTKAQLLATNCEPGVEDEPEIKIVDVFVCKLRKKLKPYGIEIETLWGQGYRMTPESKAIAAPLLQKSEAELAA